MTMDAPHLAQTRTWAAVDLDAIEHNVRVIRDLLPARTAMMAVVKADGYGHGAEAIARAALASGATWLGVATPQEALDLCEAGVGGRLLIFGPVADDWVAPLAAAACSLSVIDRASAAAIQRVSGQVRPHVHIKVDTGMTRLGVAVDELESLFGAIDPARIVVEGLYTHLACADEPDPAPTRAQLAAFARAARIVLARFSSVLCHAAASAGALAWPEAALYLVRIGIAMYGVPPAAHLAVPTLRPAMTLSSRVVRTRRVAAGTPVSYGATYRPPRATTIATVPLGYGDGYPRALSNAGQMVIGGRRFPIAGRVCMDFTMLDVGDAGVREGDEVVAFGAGLPAAEVAGAAGTIAYELFCRVSPRVPRVYMRAGRIVAVAAPGQASRPIGADRPGMEVR